jgi:hypothetical protein
MRRSSADANCCSGLPTTADKSALKRYLRSISNITPLASKQAARLELERMCSEFEQCGGKVSRDVGQQVQIRCGCCSVAWMVAASWAMRHTRQTCIRCGSGNLTTHW